MLAAVMACLLAVACGGGEAAPPDASQPVDAAAPDAVTLPDAHECVPVDSDGDGIADEDEDAMDADLDEDGVPARADDDSDGDGIPDTIEAGAFTVPCVAAYDSDDDGVWDAYDLDSDNDGLDDGEEDLDGDGVLDPGESDPHVNDTDGDGYPDVIEVITESDPQDPASVPPPDYPLFLLPRFNPEETRDVFLDQTSLTATDVTVSATGDAAMFVLGIDPGLHPGIPPGETVTSTIRARNTTVDATLELQIFLGTIEARDAGGALLDQQAFAVLVVFQWTTD